MLDTQTKQLINSARDILVGKVPDPKSQIEQITLALIYKFMDDMDRETVEKLKGKPKFFAGDFAKYSWRNIFNPTLGGHEMLALYAEALEKMNTNPGIHPFFREIFKNAFLPYRSPETLKLFLKTINEFNYDHSENLGNAYEYLLSILGTQGDAGQFRTPRHIIDFIVKVIDPQKHETILDPACGTAGFLLAAYKHILNANTNKTTGDKLTPDDRNRLATNLTGYDIDPNMERFALVNMFLHGFVTPQIHEYDTLSSQDRWNEYYDVILANPPFMSPKGGIRPHNRFSVKSNRSEVLFVDYIAEHLAAGGRAGVIVPEGIIFQSGTAYKSLRKMLVAENYLVGVISLPAGVFNPYSGVKTSILWLDKTLAKKTDKILFVKISSDGFDLGAQRRSVKENDLTNGLLNIQGYKQALQNGEEFTFDAIPNISLVAKRKIGEKGEYGLSVERYLKNVALNNSYFDLVALSDVCDINPESGIPLELFDKTEISYLDITSIDNKTGNINFENKINTGEAPSRARRIVHNGDVLISTVRPNLKAFGFLENIPEKVIASTGFAVLRASEKLIPKFLYYLILSDPAVSQMIDRMDKGAYPSINQKDVSELQIPLPPLSIQQELVSEIESYQKIIDGARQVVENFKPRIEVDPGWKIIELGDAPIEIIDGDRGSNYPNGNDFNSDGYCLFLNTKNVRYDGFNFSEKMFVTKEKDERLRKGKLQRGDVVLTTRGTIGNTAYYDEGVHYENIRINSGMLIFRPQKDKILTKFLFYYFQSENTQAQFKNIISGSAQPQLPIRDLKFITIPIPDLSTQCRIVEQIEREQALVRASRELVEVFEEKIRVRVKGVWGE